MEIFFFITCRALLGFNSFTNLSTHWFAEFYTEIRIYKSAFQLRSSNHRSIHESLPVWDFSSQQCWKLIPSNLFNAIYNWANRSRNSSGTRKNNASFLMNLTPTKLSTSSNIIRVTSKLLYNADLQTTLTSISS